MSRNRSSRASFGDGWMAWLLGGAVSGVAGSVGFGVVIWAVDPEILTDVIPAIYGLPTGVEFGWPFHVLHGLLLGVTFAFIVTRSPVKGTLGAPAESSVVSTMGPAARLTLTGMVYGIAIFAILPVTVLPLWVAITGIDPPGFPVLAAEVLLGHMLYGIVLGALLSIFVDVEPALERSESPLEEQPDPHRGPGD